MRSRGWGAILLALMLAATASPAKAEPTLQPRVIGGAPIEITSAPWQVLLILNGNRQCAANIVADQWLVTAAHCVDGVAVNQIRAYSGTSQVSDRGQAVPIANVFVHPQWNGATYLNDIAVIQLAVPLSFGNTQRPVALPDGLDAAIWPAAGTPATVAGWGSTTSGGAASNVLQQAALDILTGPGDVICGTYGAQFNALAQICAGKAAGGVDACQGDSGGALVVDVDGQPTMAGLVSTGIDCALPSYPGQYTRVTTYLPWVRQYVPLPIFAPQAPVGVAAKALPNRRIQVDWQPPSNDGGDPIQRYVATAQPGGRFCESASSSCVIRGLQAGRQYVVGVTAINAVGPSAATESSEVRAVDRIARAGRTVAVGKPGQRANVRAASRSICRARGHRVELLRPGICRVTVGNSLTVIQVLARPVVGS